MKIIGTRNNLLSIVIPDFIAMLVKSLGILRSNKKRWLNISDKKQSLSTQALAK